MCMRNRRPSDPRRTMSLADKEDATMKKKTLSILSLCIALFAAFALVGCGSTAKSESRERPPSPKRLTLSGLRSRCPRALA